MLRCTQRGSWRRLDTQYTRTKLYRILSLRELIMTVITSVNCKPSVVVLSLSLMLLFVPYMIEYTDVCVGAAGGV